MIMKWSAHIPSATSVPTISSRTAERRSGGHPEQVHRHQRGGQDQPRCDQACGPWKRRGQHAPCRSRCRSAAWSGTPPRSSRDWRSRARAAASPAGSMCRVGDQVAQREGDRAAPRRRPRPAPTPENSAANRNATGSSVSCQPGSSVPANITAAPVCSEITTMMANSASACARLLPALPVHHRAAPAERRDAVELRLQQPEPVAGPARHALHPLDPAVAHGGEVRQHADDTRGVRQTTRKLMMSTASQ